MEREHLVWLPSGEQFVVRVEEADSHGGLPGVDLFVAPTADQREDARLPSAAEWAHAKDEVVAFLDRAFA